MRRHLVALLLGLGLVIAIYALLKPRPGITELNARRIEVGMSLPQVEELMGRSPNAWRMYNAGRHVEHIWVEGEDRVRVIFVNDLVGEHDGPWCLFGSHRPRTMHERVFRWVRSALN